MSRASTVELAIEHALLGFLRESPMHGYEIYQRLSDAGGLGLVWSVKQSQLYALLARLEKQGYVAATLELQESRPPRKVFHLTPAGEAAYRAWIHHPVPHGRQVRLHFLVKFFFAQREGPETTLHLLKEQRRTCQDWLGQIQASAGNLAAGQHYAALVYEFRRGQIQAMLDWLAASEQKVAAGEISV